MLLGGLQKIVTPLEAKAMILTLDKSDQVEKQLQAQRETVHGGHCGKDGKRPPATQSRDPEQPEKQQHGGGAKPPWDPRNKSKGRTWTRGNEYGSRNKREETIRQYSLDRKEDVGGVYVKLRLENVFYPPQHQNLLSQAEAHGQGFDVAYNNAKRRYSLLKKGTVALQADMHRCGLRMFTDLLSR
ncbi:hypothetical protein PC123_g11191 [Phytophthora cactorum]|nr:hypothetical protein PC123_g11191 [Phytophthora cactorum]